MNRQTLIIPCLTLLLALALTACQRQPQIHEATFTATDYAFAGPDTLPAGWNRITLQNEGGELHHGQLLRLPADRTLDDLIAAMQEDPTHPPHWLAYEGGPGVYIPGESGAALIELEAGNYVLICVLPDAQGVPHAAHGMMKPLTVTGGDYPADEEPVAADVTMQLVDYSFTLSKEITAGSNTVRVENDGSEPHEVAVVKLAPGATAQEFVAAFAPNAPPGPPPGQPIGGLQVIDPGDAGYFTAEFESGATYALICFHPNEEGVPHLALGMVQEFTVD